MTIINPYNLDFDNIKYEEGVQSPEPKSNVPKLGPLFEGDSARDSRAATTLKQFAAFPSEIIAGTVGLPGFLKGITDSVPSLFPPEGSNNVSTTTALSAPIGAGKAVAENDPTKADNPTDRVTKAFTDSAANSSSLKAAGSIIKETENILGTGPAKSTTDQIVRHGPATFLPGPKIPAVTALGKALRALGYIATPMLGPGKYKVARGGTQFGLGMGADQAMRQVANDPNRPSIYNNLTLDIGSDTVADPLDISETDALYRELDDKLRREQNKEIGYTVVAGLTAALSLYATLKYKNRSAINKAAGEGTNIYEAGVLSPTEAFAKELFAAPTKKKPSVAFAGAKQAGRAAKELMVDGSDVIKNALKAQGHSDDTIKKTIADVHFDPHISAAQVWRDGQFGQGTNLTTVSGHQLNLDRIGLGPDGIKLYDQAMKASTEMSNRTMATAYDVLIREQVAGKTIPGLKTAFDNNNLDEVTKILRANINDVEAIRKVRVGDELLDPDAVDPMTGLPLPKDKVYDIAPGMWGVDKKPIKNLELRNIIAKARLDPKISKLMDDTSKLFDDHLTYQVQRGSITQAFADELRRGATLDGKLTYMPMFDAPKLPTTYSALKDFVGVRTNKGKELAFISNWMGRSLKHGQGTKNPMGPLAAAQRYAMHSIEAANESLIKWNILSKLAHVDSITGHDSFDVFRTMMGPNGTRSKAQRVGDIAKSKQAAEDSGVMYVGSRPVGKSAADSPIEYGVPGSNNNGYVSKLSPEQLASENMVWVQRGGKEHGFFINDPTLVASLNFHPEITNVIAALANTSKNVFTNFTTGNLSLFSPTSFAYGGFQQLMNTTATEGLRAGVSTIPKNFGAAWKIFSEASSRDIADYYAPRIATNTGLAKVAPQLVQTLHDSLKGAAERSMLNLIRRESGGISTGSLAGTEFSGNYMSHMNQFVPNFNTAFGDTPQLVWRMWRNFNTAMHGAAGLSAQLRKLAEVKGPITPQHLREARQHAADIVGDVTVHGASKLAVGIGQSVPFAGATIQAARTIGRAIRSNPGKFAATTAAIVGVPTITELVYHRNLDSTGEKFTDENGVEWTYNDWYWNGLTTEQRASNYIRMNPGEPPWKAFIYPLSPEASLIKAAYLETLDAAFNFSNVGTAGLTNENGHHMTAALSRVLDLPLPRPLAALMHSLGFELRAGALPNIDSDPADPGQTISPVQITSFGKGESITRASGSTRYANQEFQQSTVKILQDLFGATGSAIIAGTEGILAGYKQEGGSALRGIELGTDEFLTGMGRQLKFANPILGTSLRPNPNTDIAIMLISKRKGLERLTKDASILFGGAQRTKTGGLIPGSSVQMTNDPIIFEAAAASKFIKSNIDKIDKGIRRLTVEVQALGNSQGLDKEGTIPLSVKDRNKKIDDLNLRIAALKAQQYASMVSFENHLSELMTEKLGRETSINFSTLIDRKLPKDEPSLQEGFDVIKFNRELPDF